MAVLVLKTEDQTQFRVPMVEAGAAVAVMMTAAVLDFMVQMVVMEVLLFAGQLQLLPQLAVQHYIHLILVDQHFIPTNLQVQVI